MSHAKGRISRRTLLRGAGAAVALPLLEAMLPRGARAGAPAVRPPRRLGIFTVTGGTVWESWRPKEAGRLTRLPSILRPLEPFRDDLLVLSGLSQSGRCDGVNAHEHCAYKHLTGAEMVKREGGRIYAGVSVDQAAARVLGRQTLLPSLEIGRTSNQYSFRSADVPVPYEGNPRLVFERMFRGRQPVVPNWARRAKAPADGPRDAAPESPDRAVLDLVLDQARDLRRGLGRSDQDKLDRYLDSVHAVEKRIAFLEARRRQEAEDRAHPGPSRLRVPDNLPRSNDAYWKLVQLADHDPEYHGEYIRLLADLMVLAFQTDSTRVVTVAAGSDDCLFPGVVTVGSERHCHTLEHLGNAGRPEDADPIAREACRQIHAWYTALFAEMVGKMKDIDEGGSSLLDSCLLLYTSYMADGGHGQDNYPVVLVGKAGGTLRTGRHVVYEQKAPVSNLYVEVLNRLGIATETFGDCLTSRFAGSYNGRLPGLA